METYAKHQPTGFDPAGAFLPDRQSWLVAPVAQTRDSDTLTRSNFTCFLREVGGESESVEVHRFGHWGPGWYEIILIAPDTPQAIIGGELEAALSDYPVIDEGHWSALEWEEAQEYWSALRLSDRVQLCAEANVSIFAARSDSIPEDDTGRIYDHCRA